MGEEKLTVYGDNIVVEDISLMTGDISFYTNKKEPILQLKHNGDIYVHGRLVENDKEVVDAMREFLATV